VGHAFAMNFTQFDEGRRVAGSAPVGEAPRSPPTARDACEADLAIPPGVTPRLVKVICKLRREREEFVPARLLADPAWEILLQLYAAHVEQQRVSISNLAAMTGLPGTTALRWLGTLESEGLVGRSGDPLDSRRVFVGLAPAGVRAMNRYFARTGSWTVFL